MPGVHSFMEAPPITKSSGIFGVFVAYFGSPKRRRRTNLQSWGVHLVWFQILEDFDEFRKRIMISDNQILFLFILYI